MSTHGRGRSRAVSAVALFIACAAAFLLFRALAGDAGPTTEGLGGRSGGERRAEREADLDSPRPRRSDPRVTPATRPAPEGERPTDEPRTSLTTPDDWPEFTLAVRDADTGAHLDDVELGFLTTAMMGTPRQPGSGEMFTMLGGGLSSPIVLRGCSETDDPEERIAGITLLREAGGARERFEFSQVGRVTAERGVIVYAHAPGYAWASLVLDVANDTERELLLRPGAAVNVRFSSVRLERYAELDASPMLRIDWQRDDGGVSYARHEALDEGTRDRGLQVEGLDPGEYVVSVELRGSSWAVAPVLARETISLAPGERREVALTLAEPPPALPRATLEGVISFPSFAGEASVRLQLYHETSWFRSPGVDLALDDLDRVGGSLPTWSFHAEDLPVGVYQLQLLPFLTSWMVELPPEGRSGVELVVPELAEVVVETLDARTGASIPFDALFHRNEDVLLGQHHNHWSRAVTEAPGRFRFWATPGAATMWTSSSPSGTRYGRRWMDLDLAAGLQSLRFEFDPVCALRILFREDGAALHRFDDAWAEMNRGDRFRAVEHDGQLASLGELGTGELVVEVNAPGSYAIDFDGVGADRFLPVPTRRVEAREGETVEVIVELRRK